jgi:hypothetical protein
MESNIFEKFQALMNAIDAFLEEEPADEPLKVLWKETCIFLDTVEEWILNCQESGIDIDGIFFV